MAWSKEQKGKTMEQVDKLIAAGMGKKEAVKEVAGEMGIHPRTIETWLWPNKRKKHKSGGASFSKASSTKVMNFTKVMNIGAKLALAVFVQLLMDDDGDVTIKSLDAGGTPVRVGEWIQEAKDRGHQDAVILGVVAGALYNEAARLKKLNAELELKLATQL